MRIIQPIAIEPGTPLLEYGSLSLDFLAQQYVVADPIGDPTVLIATNVPEDDAAPWAAGSYSSGNTVLFDHQVYEALATTSAQPDIGAAADPPSWLLLGAANRWKMFDGIISNQTEQLGIISVSIRPGTPVNALALFGVNGSELSVRVTDPVAGIVYDETRPLQDNSAITNLYAYFFEDIVPIRDVVVLDLPSYRNATIDITIVAGADVARCGELVLGRQREIGRAAFGLSHGIDSYSKVQRNEDFGDITIVKRAYSKRCDYDVILQTNRVDAVQDLLASIRDTPIVYIGDRNRRSTIVYGFFRTFTIVLSNPATSTCSIEVEGLT
jgi:hypothetical protein